MAKPHRGASPSWERLPDESDVAFEAFVVYRDLGPQRSVRQAAANLQKTPRTLNKWRSEHDWLGRARSWDAHLQKVRDDGIRAVTRRKAVDWEEQRHRNMASEYRAAGALFRKMRKLVESSNMDVAGIGHLDVEAQVACMKVVALVYKEMSAIRWGVLNAGLGDRADAAVSAPPGGAVGPAAGGAPHGGVGHAGGSPNTNA